MKPRTSNHKPTHDQIAQRAYVLFEQSGKATGRDVENWLRAERELSAANREHNNGQAGSTQTSRIGMPASASRQHEKTHA